MQVFEEQRDRAIRGQASQKADQRVEKNSPHPTGLSRGVHIGHVSVHPGSAAAAAPVP